MAKLCLVLAGLFAVAALLWMALLPTIVEHEIASSTGFWVKADVIAANPFTGRVTLRGVYLGNPPGYPHPDFVELRGLDAELGVLGTLFSGQLVLERLDVNLAKVEIVRQRSGVLNVRQFAEGLSGGAPAGGQGAGPSSGKARYLIKDLHVRLDRLVVDDETGPNPYEKTYELNIDQRFTNVSDPKQLLVPQVVRSLYSFGLRRDAAQLLPGDFGRALAAAVDQAAQVGTKVKDAAAKTGQLLKGLFDKLEQSAKP